MLLSIDPGVVCTGWALWQRLAGWTMIACGLSRRPGDLERASLETVILFHASAIFARVAAGVSILAVERQQLSTGRDKNAPIAKGNDLLNVQAVGMFLAGMYRARLIYPTVTEWLGSSPESATRARVRATLTQSELALLDANSTGLKTVDHNLYDGVGIGLWATRRYRSGHGIPPSLADCA